MIIQHKELFEFQRGEIIDIWKCNFSVRKIEEILKHPKSTIQNIILTYKNDELEKRPSRNGRLIIISERNNYYLIRILNKNHRTNVKELCKDFITSTSTNVSSITLRRHLYKNNIYERVGTKKPFINVANKIKRLN